VPFVDTATGRLSGAPLWQKIVYPLLDVLIAVPVVGAVARGAGAGLKATSIGARVASMGGRTGLEGALKVAQQSAKTGLEQIAAKHEIVRQLQQGLHTLQTTKAAQDVILYQRDAIQAARADVTAARGQLRALRGEVTNLRQMVRGARTIAETPAELARSVAGKGAPRAVRPSAGSLAYRGAGKVRAVAGQAGRVAGPAVSGIIVGTTIYNWNELSPAERAVALAIAGVHRPLLRGIGLVETATNPYKIPLAALRPAKGKGVTLPEKPTGLGVPKLTVGEVGALEARAKGAQAIRDIVEKGDRTVEVPYGEGSVMVRGTGFQGVVGPAELHATPFIGIFQAPVLSNLERYLGKRSLTVAGKEGGLYLSYGLPDRFTASSAQGGKGKAPGGLIVGVGEISRLPAEALAKPTIKELQQAVMQFIESGELSGKMIEGFKQYKNWIELEDVITAGSQLYRVTNLRSRLADKLHLKRGEYFTQNPQGRAELVQTYLAGGRYTSYTLAELYQLKGLALRTELDNLLYGLDRRVERLRGRERGKKEPYETTKEEVLWEHDRAIAQYEKAGLLKPTEAARLRQDLRRQVVDEYNRQFVRPSASVLARITSRARQETPGRRVQPKRPEARFLTVDRAGVREEGASRQERRPGETRAPGREETPREERPPREDLPREPRPTREETPREERPPREDLPREPRPPEPRPPGPREPRPPEPRPPEPNRKIRLTTESGEDALASPDDRGVIEWDQGIMHVTMVPADPTLEADGKKPVIRFDRRETESLRRRSGLPRETLRVRGGRVPDEVRLGMGVFTANIKDGKRIGFQRRVERSNRRRRR